jgi:hypothetical protein
MRDALRFVASTIVISVLWLLWHAAPVLAIVGVVALAKCER